MDKTKLLKISIIAIMAAYGSQLVFCWLNFDSYSTALSIINRLFAPVVFAAFFFIPLLCVLKNMNKELDLFASALLGYMFVSAVYAIPSDLLYVFNTGYRGFGGVIGIFNNMLDLVITAALLFLGFLIFLGKIKNNHKRKIANIIVVVLAAAYLLRGCNYCILAITEQYKAYVFSFFTNATSITLIFFLAVYMFNQETFLKDGFPVAEPKPVAAPAAAPVANAAPVNQAPTAAPVAPTAAPVNNVADDYAEYKEPNT